MGGRGASSGGNGATAANVNKVIQMASGGESSDSYFKARTTGLDRVLSSLGIPDSSERSGEIRSALARVAYTAERKGYGTSAERNYNESVEKLRRLLKQ